MAGIFGPFPHRAGYLAIRVGYGINLPDEMDGKIPARLILISEKKGIRSHHNKKICSKGID